MKKISFIIVIKLNHIFIYLPVTKFCKKKLHDVTRNIKNQKLKYRKKKLTKKIIQIYECLKYLKSL